MRTHGRNGNGHYSSMNTTASKRLPLHRLRLRNAILLTQLSIFWASILIVHASTNAHGSPSFSTSQTTKIDSHKDDSASANKILALNVGSSSIGNNVQSQPQPYLYKDEDFVIPTIKQQPRYIQRHLNPQLSKRVRSIATSSAHWIALTLTAVSFSKALFYQLNNSFRLTTVASDDDCNDSDISTTVLESTNIEEDIDVIPSTTDHLSADSNVMPPEWKEQFDHLLVEATSLREQLSMIQQMLEKQQLDQPEKLVSSPEIIEDNADIPMTDAANDIAIAAMTTEIQSLKESVQYWKRVAEMNEQQITNVVQVERQNGIQQLEQLKIDMLQMVDQERVAMMKEFTSMIQELRDSLHSQT